MGKVLSFGGGVYFLKYLNPKMWPILAASSPRVVGEFLNAYGKASNAVKKGTGKVVDFAERAKTAAVGSGDFPNRPPEYMPPGAIPADVSTPAFLRRQLFLP